jgi:hypothetical protein
MEIGAAALARRVRLPRRLRDDAGADVGLGRRALLRRPPRREWARRRPADLARRQRAARRADGPAHGIPAQDGRRRDRRAAARTRSGRRLARRRRGPHAGMPRAPCRVRPAPVPGRSRDRALSRRAARPPEGDDVRLVDGREPPAEGSPVFAGLPAGLGQRPLRQPRARLRGGHAPDGTRLRPHRPDLLHADPGRRRGRGPPPPARDFVGRVGGGDLRRPRACPSGTARSGRERRRLPVGPRHGEAAPGLPVERGPGRVRTSAGPAAVRTHRPVRHGPLRGGPSLGRARSRGHPRRRGTPSPRRIAAAGSSPRAGTSPFSGARPSSPSRSSSGAASAAPSKG